MRERSERAGARTEDATRAIRRTMLRTIVRWGLVEDGDRILVAVSGGKDSLTLLDLLRQARRRAPVRFDLVACHVAPPRSGRDTEALEEWVRSMGVPLEVERHDTFARAEEELRRDPRASACRLCSRLRRGILYGAAARLRCNKVALGHHREDSLQTLLLNLLYAGRLQAMPARYATNDRRFVVIRPLIECAEDAIAAHSAACGYPSPPPDPCGVPAERRRALAGRLLSDLEREIPGVRGVMAAALRNVRPTHLLDREVAEAWEDASSRFAPRR